MSPDLGEISRWRDTHLRVHSLGLTDYDFKRESITSAFQPTPRYGHAHAGIVG